ncbi:glycosyltransferase [Kineococcus arenarius]|uniref:glycosyltransferase n=1 Tax=Kineococcus sp. SYSU DK007 TaxID=3383128 RepID=UPI003D7D69DC
MVLAHDYLTQRGGGERVALELARQFPGAPLLTSVYDEATTFPEFAGRDVRPSVLNRWKVFRRDPRRAFALLAPVVSRMVVPEGVLVASSSGWAHGLRAHGPKIVYCHNPARWLYQPDDYFRALPRVVRRPLSAALAPLRHWDRRAAHTVDVYLANSTSVARRIEAAYGVRARVLHPPAGLDPAGPREAVPGVEPGFLLTVGRRRGYKNTSLVCEAVEQVPGARLVAVGGLPDGRTWSDRLLGVRDISDAQLRWLYANCSAVVAMSREDFGLSPVEGFAFGKPSVVLRAGGYLDSGLEGVATLFVDEETASSLAAVLRDFDPAEFDPEKVRKHGERFSPAAFGRGLRAVVAEVLSEAPRT